MPSRKPKAAFEPIAPALDFRGVVALSSKFQPVVRIPCKAIDEQGVAAFERLVRLHVVQEGKPLVVEGYQDKLNLGLFNVSFLKERYGAKVERARDLVRQEDVQVTLRHYLENMSSLAGQFTLNSYKDRGLQRIYLKDIDTPHEWVTELRKTLPSFISYLDDGTRGDFPPATAGDLMSSLPESIRAENMQCYIGHEGTYTPAHREMCATLGHNIMVEASSNTVEHEGSLLSGSSLWFMTETKDRAAVAEYFRNMLGHDIETENHFAQLNAWRAAPFTVYITEQRPGDLVLIPPVAPHQVWNKGIRTMKVAWNRTTVETLELAFRESLASARIVCRDEQYKCKAIVYFSLEKYSRILGEAEVEATSGLANTKQLRRDFRKLFALFTEVLLSESLPGNGLSFRRMEFIKFDGNITCSYCRCNVFNRFLTCGSCIETLEDGSENNYDICLECYALGRSCYCLSEMIWCEQFHWEDLLNCHERWRAQIQEFNHNDSDKGAEVPGFAVVRSQQTRKTLAHICQDELERRPHNKLKRPLTVKELNSGALCFSPGQFSIRTSRTKTARETVSRAKNTSALRNCHICKQLEPQWRLASCGECETAYCYGSLFRAFEVYPPEVMEEFSWRCPKCLKICSCGACRRNPSMSPFEPGVTYLGHDTRNFADPRSVEILVDFSLSNASWQKKQTRKHEEVLS